jgi:hypothetical protein
MTRLPLSIFIDCNDCLLQFQRLDDFRHSTFFLETGSHNSLDHRPLQWLWESKAETSILSEVLLWRCTNILDGKSHAHEESYFHRLCADRA